MGGGGGGSKGNAAMETSAKDANGKCRLKKEEAEDVKDKDNDKVRGNVMKERRRRARTRKGYHQMRSQMYWQRRRTAMWMWKERESREVCQE